MTRYSPNHPAVRAWIENTPPDKRSIKQRQLAVRARLAQRSRRRTDWGHKTAELTGFVLFVGLLPIIVWLAENNAPFFVIVPCGMSILWTAFTLVTLPYANDDLS